MGGLGGKIATNLVAVPAVIAGVCILLYIVQKRTVKELIAVGVSDESGLRVLQVELKHRLMVGIFLVCEHQRSSLHTHSAATAHAKITLSLS